MTILLGQQWLALTLKAYPAGYRSENTNSTHPCGVLRVTSPMFLRPVPAPKATRSLEGFPATRGSAGSGGGHKYYLGMPGTRLTRNNIFQFLGDADLNAYAKGLNTRCFQLLIGASRLVVDLVRASSILYPVVHALAVSRIDMAPANGVVDLDSGFSVLIGGWHLWYLHPSPQA
ncbi:hypothetical protein ARMGADRAFT_1026420 [Armillaria gallica]|uniref:Uncharacterized protein n=1 Tax=Armillaria gallica TaxID=47427 RepID=A0A2H3DT48_ARMGA|nr:hypothetical protein ARMGADRAFT_1026420 [Armillaria gallica]